MDFYESERDRMVVEQIMRRGIRDPRLLEAMKVVPRHLFVPEEVRHLAYADGPLPIGFGQTISQPFIVAFMTDMLRLKGHERVLEVGTGSGYQAAILAHLAREVHTVEMIPPLAARAAALLAAYPNVYCHQGDGSLGWPEAQPYDGIIVTAAAPKVPPALLAQLADGGWLVLPVGSRGDQLLEVWEREGEEYKKQVELSVAFVPLRGKNGWREE
ncbi:MAG: protein-L-isoaspartate(D-aspartate) O-methyltransferase [Anaerolineae bacterium]